MRAPHPQLGQHGSCRRLGADRSRHRRAAAPAVGLLSGAGDRAHRRGCPGAGRRGRTTPRDRSRPTLAAVDRGGRRGAAGGSARDTARLTRAVSFLAARGSSGYFPDVSPPIVAIDRPPAPPTTTAPPHLPPPPPSPPTAPPPS